MKCEGWRYEKTLACEASVRWEKVAEFSRASSLLRVLVAEDDAGGGAVEGDFLNGEGDAVFFVEGVPVEL